MGLDNSGQMASEAKTELLDQEATPPPTEDNILPVVNNGELSHPPRLFFIASQVNFIIPAHLSTFHLMQVFLQRILFIFSYYPSTKIYIKKTKQKGNIENREHTPQIQTYSTI